MKIITGNTGMKHVTSEDDGTLYASIVGKEDYILDMNENFSHEIIDVNTIRINSGDALLNGRQVRIPRGSYDTVSIDNGQTGYKRIDLIVIRYESNMVIENASLVVIKGIATTGTPITPEYQKESILDGALIHDVPLYKVHLDGINLEKVEKLFVERNLSATNLGYRPNLLINGDFRNPINQRGLTTYFGQTQKRYTIDRWCTGEQDYERTVEIIDGAIKITNPNATYVGTLQQFFENTLPLADYTLSVRVLEISGTATMSCSGSHTETKKELNVGINTMTLENATIDSFKIYIAPQSSITLEWAKLEQGSIATPFIPRLYAEELALCQRYFIDYKPLDHSGLLGGTGDRIYVPLHIVANMRTTPNVISGITYINVYIDGTAKSTNVSAVSVNSDNELVFAITPISGMTTRICAFFWAKDSKMQFDAEIY